MKRYTMTGCNKCGNCCHDHTILITFRDLREIHEFYPEIEIEGVITLYEPSAGYEDTKFLKENYPLIKFEENNTIINGYLGLRFQEAGNQSVCPFLDAEFSGCKIHNHKPYICRVYPHKVDLKWHGRCRSPWNIPDERRNELEKTILDAKKSYDDFRTEVEQWNTIYSKKSISSFIEFILTKGK